MSIIDSFRSLICRRKTESPSNVVGTLNHSTRVEWVKRKLEGLSPGGKLLDAGAGEMQFKRFCSHLNYVSQDFGKYDGRGDGAGLQMGTWSSQEVDIVSDITSIPALAASFDAILCTEVFEHLPDPISAVKEFSRLLRSGGQLIITAPFCSLTHFAPYHFYTGFNRYFYEFHLGQFGFEILEITENGNFFEFLAQELRRIPEVAKTYCLTRVGSAESRAINRLLPLLATLSSEDRGSKELLHFDFQVHAKKH